MAQTCESPRPRWLQFRLRTLFVAMTIFGAIFIGVQALQDWRRRERARAQFEKTLDLWDTPAGRVQRIE